MPREALGPEATDSILGKWPGPGAKLFGPWEPTGEVRERWPLGPLQGWSRGRKWGARPVWEAMWLAWAVWSAWSGVAGE